LESVPFDETRSRPVKRPKSSSREDDLEREHQASSQYKR
jgi:hypothetical protein